MPAFTREERARQRADQNRELVRFHRQLDLMAQDTRYKFERPSFVVVTASVPLPRAAGSGESDTTFVLSDTVARRLVCPAHWKTITQFGTSFQCWNPARTAVSQPETAAWGFVT